MQSGNGIDLAAIYQLLQQVAEKLADHDRRFDLIDRRFEQIDRRFEQIDRRFEQIDRHLGTVTGVLTQHSERLDELSAAVVELLGAVSNYHGAVISQGLHYSELDGRVHRIERHLKLEPNGG